jgi:hypothetical protein
MNFPAVTSSSARSVPVGFHPSPLHSPEDGFEVANIAGGMMVRFTVDFPFESESGDAVTD